ncbi:uncharacterized protein LOC123522855 [Mercenaria mercenaria]|uniref:uncharacterized protein LOC123522855 n=1 Tax=Mercenaria mercenaria TaxID=6596 RepID=UPI00234F7032|nr:uncharacterized protein LOC123522855 [Mercenaria mercenaria]
MMFQQIFRRMCSIQPMLRLTESKLFPRSICSVTAKTNVLKEQDCYAKHINKSQGSRSLSSMGPLGNSVLKSGKCITNSILKSGEGNSIVQSSLPTAPLINLLSVRTLRWYYRPSAIRRMRKHGLEKRLSKRSQREVLFRRILAGRGTLTTFDRFMNEVPEVMQKKKGRRVDLFDPKKGYKSIIKKKDKFIFKEI